MKNLLLFCTVFLLAYWHFVGPEEVELSITGPWNRQLMSIATTATDRKRPAEQKKVIEIPISYFTGFFLDSQNRVLFIDASKGVSIWTKANLYFKFNASRVSENTIALNYEDGVTDKVTAAKGGINFIFHDDPEPLFFKKVK